MSVLMYNNVNIKKIKFSDRPYKKIKKIKLGDSTIVKSIYYIDIDYDNRPLYVQMPSCKFKSINEDDNMITFIIDKIVYRDFIKRLENYVVENVYENSETWFSGKVFTMSKIIKCFVSSVDHDHGQDHDHVIDDDNCEFSMSFSKYLKIYDQFKTNLSLEDINIKQNEELLEVVSIINIRNLQFIDNMFTCNILLEQMKVYTDTRIVGYSIMESEPSFSISIQNDVSSDSLLMDEYYSGKI